MTLTFTAHVTAYCLAGIMDQSAILASEAGKLTVTDCLRNHVHTVAPPWAAVTGMSPPYRFLLLASFT